VTTKTLRAVVTGIGVLSPVGCTRRDFTRAVIDGRSGIERITSFDPAPFRTPFGGEVKDLDLPARLGDGERELFPDRYLQLALVAARDALVDAGLDWSRSAPSPHRSALVVGTCNGGLRTAEKQYEIILGLTPGKFDRRMNLVIRYHALGKTLSYSLGHTGPTWVVTTACSSSTAALAAALELISHGEADTVLVGGSDALCLATMAGFDALKATSVGRTAPFSNPAGLNLGEGAAFWVVEELGKARDRGARIEGELLGYALTADAHHPTAPDPRGDGAYRTMRGALARAGLTAEEIGCVNAHGTGTEANDRTESKAVARLAGDHHLPVHSFKSQVGHCLGAAGILEATAGLAAMHEGVIPATVNFTEPRPGCNLDYVPNTQRKADYSSFLSCNYAFGGNNAGIAIGLFDEDRGPAAGPDPAARTVLTGGGAVTSLGLGARCALEAMRSGRRGFSSIAERVSAPTQASLAGLVAAFRARDVDRRLDFKGMNPLSIYATAAARLALGDAGLRVGPREGLETGVVNGLYAGPGEEGQMMAVVPSGGAEADIGVFSHIVANSTSGWVSNALLLKGYATTVSQGPDAGLFAILMAHLAVTSRSSPRILAGASDELFSRYLRNYDELDLLHTGRDEQEFRLRLDVPDRRVLGEGAAYVVAEELDVARTRGAKILAEIKGHGMTTDCSSFYDPMLKPDGLIEAIDRALKVSGWSPEDVGLVIWSPQGNASDAKVLDAVEAAFGNHRPPLVTSVFHTGLCESASGSVTLAAMLGAWSRDEPLWPQITGLDEIDGRTLPAAPVPALAIAASELGYNLALAIEPWEGDGR